MTDDNVTIHSPETQDEPHTEEVPVNEALPTQATTTTAIDYSGSGYKRTYATKPPEPKVQDKAEALPPSGD